MCRSIKDLRSLSGEPASEPKDTEIQEAALQFVRKISGNRKPSVANTSAFGAAIAEVAASSRKLLLSLEWGRSSQTARQH